MSDVSTPPWASLLPQRQPDQIALVVDDLDASMRTWSLLLGTGTWRVYSYGPGLMEYHTVRGEVTNYGMRLGLFGANPQLELIESTLEPNIYAEQRQVQGPGLHHVGYFIESIADLEDAFREYGISPIQTGRGYGLDGDGGFAYYELPGFECLVEFIEVPKRRKPSEV